MKDYNSMKHTLLVFNSKETLVDTIIEQDKEKERLKERLSLYESDTDTVVMSKDKWEEIKQEIERLNNIINKALYILEHIDDDRVGYVAVKEILKGVDKE